MSCHKILVAKENSLFIYFCFNIQLRIFVVQSLVWIAWIFEWHDKYSRLVTMVQGILCIQQKWFYNFWTKFDLHFVFNISPKAFWALIWFQCRRLDLLWLMMIKAHGHIAINNIKRRIWMWIDPSWSKQKFDQGHF